jgi:hypothetical protein
MYHPRQAQQRIVDKFPILAGCSKSSSSKASPILSLSLGERPRVSFTARIERAQFHRARSASKKGTWPFPPCWRTFSAFCSLRRGGGYDTIRDCDTALFRAQPS